MNGRLVTNAVAFTFLFLACSLPAQVCFSPAQTYSVGGDTRYLETGDFNNDGYPDIAVLQNSRSEVSILINDGSGGFQISGAYPTSGGPVHIAVGDFLKDGNLDIAVGASFFLDILPGNGDGTFAGKISTLFTNSPKRICSGYFNNDSLIDIAVSTSGYQKIEVALSDGQGTFWSTFAYAAGGYPNFITSNDFDYDGQNDLLFFNSSGGGQQSGLHLFKGLVNGTFQNDTVLGRDYVYVQNLAVADFDGDGYKDWLPGISGGFHYLEFWIGDGNGSYAQTHTDSSVVLGRDVGSADFDLDGKPDLFNIVTGGFSGSLNRGGARFGPWRYYATPKPTWDHSIADFDQNGKPDIALTSYEITDDTYGSVSVFLNCTPVGRKEAEVPGTLNLAPNPADQETWLIQGNFQQDLEVRILDSRGRSLTPRISKNGNRVHIDCQQLPSGIYFVQAMQKNGPLQTLKMIIQH